MATVNPNNFGLTSGLPLLNLDPEQLQRMEDDLAQKVQDALAGLTLSVKIHGIFSIDDLENKRVSDLCNGPSMAIGIGYLGSEGLERPQRNVTTSHGNAAKAVEFSYMILLAIPADDKCTRRYDGMKLLAALRNRILGSTIDGDRVNRVWDFVQEKPDIGESSKEMLYYSQVWRTVMQATGK